MLSLVTLAVLACLKRASALPGLNMQNCRALGSQDDDRADDQWQSDIQWQQSDFAAHTQIARMTAAMISHMDEGATPTVIKNQLEQNMLMWPEIFGVCIAFEPDSYPMYNGVVNRSSPELPGGVHAAEAPVEMWGAQTEPWTLQDTEIWSGQKALLYAAYVFRSDGWKPGDKFATIDLADLPYNYWEPRTEWFHAPRAKFMMGEMNYTDGYWTKLYRALLEGKDVHMVTYSVPFWSKRPPPKFVYPNASDPNLAPYGVPVQAPMTDRYGETRYFWGIATIDIVLQEVMQRALPCQLGYERLLDVGTQTSTCTACPVGKHSSTGDGECQLCEAGTFANTTGLSQCFSCDIGFWSPGGNMTSCYQCPPYKTTVSTSTKKVDACVCNGARYQGLQRYGDDCGCPNGHFMNQRDEVCTECGEGQDCLWHGNSYNPQASVDLPRVVEGYWAEYWAGTSSDFAGYSVYTCYSKRVCKGGVGVEACATGRTGVACASCQPGMYGGPDGDCADCTSKPETQWTILIVIMPAFLILVYIAVVILAGATEDTSLMKSLGQNIRSLKVTFRQMFKYLQLVCVISFFSVKWPGGMMDFFDVMNRLRLSFDLTSGCFMDEQTPGLLLAWRWLTPLVLYSLVLAAWPFSKLVVACPGRLSFLSKHKDRMDLNGHKITTFVYMFWTMAFPTMTQDSLMVFHCVTSPNGVTSINSFRNVVCGEAEFNALLPGAFLSTCVWLIGFFAWTLYAVYRVSTSMREGCAQRLKLGKLSGEIATEPLDRGRWDSACEDFRDLYVYWPLCALVKDLLLAAVVVIFPEHPTRQLLLAAGVLAIYGFASLRTCPFKDRKNSILEVFCSWSLMLSLIFTMSLGFTYNVEDVFTGGFDDPEYKARAGFTLGWSLFSLVVIILFVAVGIALSLPFIEKRMPLFIRSTPESKKLEMIGGLENFANSHLRWILQVMDPVEFQTFHDAVWGSSPAIGFSQPDSAEGAISNANPSQVVRNIILGDLREWGNVLETPPIPPVKAQDDVGVLVDL